MAATRFAIVGNGWRAQFFHRIAAALPDEFEIVGVVVRSASTADAVAATWGAPTFDSLGTLFLRERPDFVVASVPRNVASEVMAECVVAGVAVLSETPPADSADDLRRLWHAVGASGLVQVAEQYLLLPAHAARREIVRRGTIGTPTSVQVSSTHLYHAVSMIRGFLGSPFGPTEVRSQAFDAPLVDPMGQRGWTDDSEPHPAVTTIATIDFGSTHGVYDFTDNQWHNHLRSRRIVVRGSHGEIANDEVFRMPEPHTFATSPILRRQLGYDLDLDGYDTDHITFEGTVVWRNEFLGARFSDEEIAIATLLRRTAAWVGGTGPAPYPLAEASQDHLIGLAIEESAASGAPVRTGREPWAPA
ncbi:MAG TPA: Gfo/Idh/MocA family oxidoreductase [Galbitalea sp.]